MILQRVDYVLCVVDHQLVGLAGCVAPSLDLLSAVFREAFLVPEDRRDEKNVPLVAQVGQFLEIRQKLLLLFCVVMHLARIERTATEAYNRNLLFLKDFDGSLHHGGPHPVRLVALDEEVVAVDSRDVKKLSAKGHPWLAGLRRTKL